MTLKLNDPAFLSRAASSILPTSYGTVVAWWKADSFALTDGTAIGGTGVEWTDQSGNNFHLAQSSSGSQPLFKTNIFGTKPAIRFDGSNDFLTFPSTLVTTGSWTIVGICTASTDSFLVGKSDIAVQIRIINGGNNIAYNTGSSSDFISDTFSNASTSIRMNTWQGDNPNSLIKFRENKTSRNQGSVSINGVNLNRLGTPSFANFYTGDMAEVVIWQTLLTSVQLDSLYDSYFKPRWGLP